MLSFLLFLRAIRESPLQCLTLDSVTAPSPLSASQTFPHTVGNHPRGGREDCGGGKPPALPGFIWFSRNFAGRCGHRPLQILIESFVILFRYYSKETSMLLSVEVTVIFFMGVPRLSIIRVEILSSILRRITLRKSLAPLTLPSIFETITDGIFSS